MIAYSLDRGRAGHDRPGYVIVETFKSVYEEINRLKNTMGTIKRNDVFVFFDIGDDIQSVDLAPNDGGTANRVARSDHKHDLDEDIAPTWTSPHIWNVPSAELSATRPAVEIISTLPFADAAYGGVHIDTTSPAVATSMSKGSVITGMDVHLHAGYTGTGRTSAAYITNFTAGTGTNPYADQADGANFGAVAQARATTSGYNIGAFLQGIDGALNSGSISVAYDPKIDARNVGLVSHGRNVAGGANAVEIAGYFSTHGPDVSGGTFTKPNFVAIGSAVLIADNVDRSIPIAQFREGGAVAWQVSDGGGLIYVGPNISASNLPFAIRRHSGQVEHLFTIQPDTGPTPPLLHIDSTGRRIGFRESASDPALLAENAYLYARDVLSLNLTELFYSNSAGTAYRLTDRGALNGATVKSAVADGASAVAWDFIDTVARTQGLAFQMSNSASSKFLMATSYDGRFAFGYNTSLTPQTGHILSFLMTDTNSPAGAPHFGGILAACTHNQTTQTVSGPVFGVVGAGGVTVSTGFSGSSVFGTAGVAICGMDDTNFSAKNAAGVVGRAGATDALSISEPSAFNQNQLATSLPKGNWALLAQFWADYCVPSGTMSLPTNRPAIFASYYAPIQGYSSTTGEQWGIYGDTPTGGGTPSPTTPAVGGFIRIPFAARGTRRTAAYFIPHAASAGGPTGNASGDVYFDSGASNQAGLWEFTSAWAKLLTGLSASPSANGGTALGGNGLGWGSLWLKDTAAAFEVQIQTTDGAIAADRVLTLNLNNANRTLKLNPQAYTQNFTTADRTINAYTADDESAAYTGIDNLQVGTVYATVADVNALRVAYENLRAMAEDLLQAYTATLDDLQDEGLAA